jgi:hypothetical protein
MARKPSETVRSNGNANQVKASETQLTTLSDDRIAERAYFKWQQRGCAAGDDVRDWLEARDELQKEFEGDAPVEQNT